MFRILTMNKIASVIDQHLPADAFKVGGDIDNPNGILVRSADMHSYARGEDLLAIARAGAGVNNIPVDDCSKDGIVVFNTPGANANAVKELVLASLLLCTRKIVDGMSWVQSLKGQGDEVPKLVEKGKSQFVGPELKGKKLGVVGLGAIGVMVANDARALGMTVIGYDPYISVEHAWGLSRGIKRETNLEKMLSQCQYITVHVPQTEKTKGMFNAELLHKVRRGATVLNFSRGGLVDDEAMLAALKRGRVGRYVTDFPNEALLGQSGVMAIPHLGASTPESEDNCAEMAAAQMNDYLTNGNIRNSVNYPDCQLPRTSSHRITVMHANVTNMVGQMSALLAEYNQNISDMINKSRGALAYTIIDTDHDIEPELEARLRQIEGVVRVRSLGRAE
nr:phosphoglycerate dehydrogenase [Maliibacterium massiliense]